MTVTASGKSHFPLLDFDGTVARTFDRSPSGIGVHEAHREAVKTLFGKEGSRRFEEIGGLKNRAPTELVRALVNGRPQLVRHARVVILDTMPQVLTDRSSIEGAIAEALVLLKLEILIDQISDDWPKPCKGFLRFAQTIESLVESGLDVELGILSAGHERFIEKTFDVWGIDRPTVMVTDDDIRHLPDAHLLGKPSVHTFEIAEKRWKAGRPNTTREDIVYFGDDPRKDGGVAAAAGVPFGWFVNGNLGQAPDHPVPDNSFSFGDWTVVSDHLMQNEDLLRQGRSCHEIFTNFRPGR